MAATAWKVIILDLPDLSCELKPECLPSSPLPFNSNLFLALIQGAIPYIWLTLNIIWLFKLQYTTINRKIGSKAISNTFSSKPLLVPTPSCSFLLTLIYLFIVFVYSASFTFSFERCRLRCWKRSNYWKIRCGIALDHFWALFLSLLVSIDILNFFSNLFYTFYGWLGQLTGKIYINQKPVILL